MQLEAHGQINLKSEVIDSIWNHNNSLGHELKAISLYNKIINSESLSDTISVGYKNGVIIFRYNEKEVKDLKIDRNKKEALQFDYSNNKHSDYFLHATVQKSKVDEIHVIAFRTDSCNVNVRIKNYRESVLFGDYKEKCLDDQVYVSGKYHHVDSIYQDTTIYYDPETYDETIEIEERQKFPVKCGVWMIQTEEGLVAKKFDPCK